MMIWSRRAGVVVVAAALVTAAAVVTVGAMVSAESDPDVYSACLDKQDKTLYKVGINVASPPSCRTGDKRVQWNSEGPRGPRGVRGPAGPTSLAALDGTACTTAQGHPGVVVVTGEEDNVFAVSCDSPQQEIILSPEAATKLADLFAGTSSLRSVEIPASCSGNVKIACPGGSPSNPLPTVVVDDIARAGDSPRAIGTYPLGESRFDIAGRFRVTTPTSIPVSYEGNECGLTIDTPAGSIPDVRVAFSATIDPGQPSGPVSIGDLTLTDLETGPDIAITGANPACAFADANAQFVVPFFVDSLEAYVAGEVPLCAAPAPIYFEVCA